MVFMDMWPPFFQSSIRHVPMASEKIVFDRFHMICHVGKAVDTVRKRGISGWTGSGAERHQVPLAVLEGKPSGLQRSRIEVLRALNLNVGLALGHEGGNSDSLEMHLPWRRPRRSRNAGSGEQLTAD